MSFLRNKHVVAAMLVTPVLAVLAYILTDYFVRQQPHSAVQGQSYTLVAQSNCRYTSGRCDLRNASFEASLTIQKKAEQSFLVLQSKHSLQGVTLGFVEGERARPPVHMTSTADDGRHWSSPLTVAGNQYNTARLVLTADQIHYLAETTLGFGEYQTPFPKNF